MRASRCWMAFLLLAGCGAESTAPTPPPTPTAASLTVKADGTCQYNCATYHYAAGQCFQGWQCDAAGQCLSYVGTPDAPEACPGPTPPCVPTTCAAQNKNCGSLPDGCGGTLDCGGCTNGASCQSNVCVDPSDPFDPAICQGAPITVAQAIPLFPAGASHVTLGPADFQTRYRSCNALTGCSAWGPTFDEGSGSATVDLGIDWANRILLSVGNYQCGRIGDSLYCSEAGGGFGLTGTAFMTNHCLQLIMTWNDPQNPTEEAVVNLAF